MNRRAAFVIAACACSGGCSGGKAKAVEDARRAAPGDGGPAVRDIPAGPYRVDPGVKTGDVQIRVEWKDVPQALRASPGPTPCGSPAAPPLAPTTTWGIPDAFVAIEVDHGKPLSDTRARIVLEQCALSPRVAVTGGAFAIASAVEQPATVMIAEAGRLPLGGAPPPDTGKRSLYLPIIGHEVTVAATPGAIYTVATGAEPNASATVISAMTPYLAVTEVTGQVVLRDVPIGSHPVRAWLPERGALKARVATGTVTVTAGALAEVTLDISTP